MSRLIRDYSEHWESIDESCRLRGGEGGIRTHVPGYPDHLISSQRRYGHFGTSPLQQSILPAYLLVISRSSRARVAECLGSPVVFLPCAPFPACLSWLLSVVRYSPPATVLND